MIAADIRATRIQSGRLIYQDDAEKIRRMPAGLTAAAGCADFIEPVWERIMQSDALLYSEIDSIIKDEALKISQNASLSQAAKNQIVSTTAWMFTGKTIHSLKLVVWGLEGKGQVSQGDIFVFIPGDMTLEQNERLRAELRMQLKQTAGFRESAEYHADLAGRFIADVAKRTSTVSDSYQVGLHHLEHGCIISPATQVGHFSINFPG